MLKHNAGYGAGFSGKQKNESLIPMDQQDCKECYLLTIASKNMNSKLTDYC